MGPLKNEQLCYKLASVESAEILLIERGCIRSAKLFCICFVHLIKIKSSITFRFPESDSVLIFAKIKGWFTDFNIFIISIQNILFLKTPLPLSNRVQKNVDLPKTHFYTGEDKSYHWCSFTANNQLPHKCQIKPEEDINNNPLPHS